MKLVSLLSESRILSEMRAATRWESHGELVSHLVAGGDFPALETDGLLEALRAREEQVSTGIGHGVAVPHAYCEDLEEPLAVFGRSREGIEYEACDNAPVHFLIMLLVPTNGSHSHLKTLAAVAGLFSRKEVRERLKHGTDSAELFQILRDCEG